MNLQILLLQTRIAACPCQLHIGIELDPSHPTYPLCTVAAFSKPSLVTPEIEKLALEIQVAIQPILEKHMAMDPTQNGGTIMLRSPSNGGNEDV